MIAKTVRSWIKPEDNIRIEVDELGRTTYFCIKCGARLTGYFEDGKWIEGNITDVYETGYYDRTVHGKCGNCRISVKYYG